MSLSRIWMVLKKDLALGPRSPIFLFVIALPIVLTAVFQLAFGSILEPEPRMAIVDDGGSAITAAVQDMAGIDLTVLGSADELIRAVEANSYDVGLVLPAGFDDAVRSGAKPPLEMYVSGESYASNRIVLSVTTLDLVREVEGTTPPVDVQLVSSGSAGLPIALRLVPVIVMYALFIAGAFLPASSIVDERVHETFTAMLVTPAKVSEILVAKAALGALMAFLMSIVTLLLNNALGGNWPQIMVVVALGAVFSSLLGLVIGSLAKDGAMLFTIVKSSGILLFGPVIFYLFPDWPQWIARLFPTYWMIDPIWRVSVLGESLRDVWGSIAIAIAIGLALVPIIVRLSRRMLSQLAAAS